MVPLLINRPPLVPLLVSVREPVPVGKPKPWKSLSALLARSSFPLARTNWSAGCGKIVSLIVQIGISLAYMQYAILLLL